MNMADHARVSAAVHAAEQGTAGEIVTIIAETSDRYLDIALWWSVAAAIGVLTALGIFSGPVLALIASFTGGWASEWTIAHIFELALATVIISFGIVRLALIWSPLLLILTPARVKSGRVRRRAVRYFKVGAQGRTTGRTAILIYLSMAEHRAEIVADETIHSVVAPEVWGEAMARLIADARHGRIADGMIAAIADVGAILATHVPRLASDTNELPDRLIEL